MTGTSPMPPVTIRSIGPGRVLVRGVGRRSLDAAGAGDRVWSAERGGWIVSADAVGTIVDWARGHGRGVDLTEAVR
jgi:hypothetical protein